ncbi:MAG: electron transfer flavoprotein subunit beta/FixA family protein, partial [Desulfobacteraceae bacterium]
SANGVLNPYCEYALDHAVRLKAAQPGIRIIALSMGPAQAETALVRCLELGADQGILVSDRKLAGADTLATALTLAAAIRKLVPDYTLILVGKQAIDSDTAQVGPGIAEILGLPQILYGVKIWIAPDRKHVRVKRDSRAGFEVLEAKLPTLVSASKGEAVRRMPSVADFLRARRKNILKVSASDLDLHDSELGISGSFTQVKNMFLPDSKQSGLRIEGLEPSSAAKEIAEFLKSKGYV